MGEMSINSQFPRDRENKHELNSTLKLDEYLNEWKFLFEEKLKIFKIVPKKKICPYHIHQFLGNVADKLKIYNEPCFVKKTIKALRVNLISDQIKEVDEKNFELMNTVYIKIQTKLSYDNKNIRPKKIVYIIYRLQTV
ncbi:hypothetical protein A3Q56_05445 [Intoshia linei]|uniref:Uncharacterized protein n=1 Tax=Intoshia linei TaxID=1819745 RepID=A0A177B087_9BILA|nr:hypothetical protein A3Q56_05445 [Intoshia linei]